MTSVPQSADVPPPPCCPTCGTNAYKKDIRLDKIGVTTGSYLCPEGHAWVTKWLAVAA